MQMSSTLNCNCSAMNNCAGKLQPPSSWNISILIRNFWLKFKSLPWPINKSKPFATLRRSISINSENTHTRFAYIIGQSWMNSYNTDDPIFPYNYSFKS
jgi:hypothetical protein